MAVVKIESGMVVQTWRDVETVADAVAKYGLDPSDLVDGNHAPGTLYDGVSFSPPPPPPSLPPPPERDHIQALRELAPLIGPAAVVLIDARFGVKPV